LLIEDVERCRVLSHPFEKCAYLFIFAMIARDRNPATTLRIDFAAACSNEPSQRAGQINGCASGTECARDPSPPIRGSRPVP